MYCENGDQRMRLIPLLESRREDGRAFERFYQLAHLEMITVNKMVGERFLSKQM
jgi:hypothetical protein